MYLQRDHQGMLFVSSPILHGFEKSFAEPQQLRRGKGFSVLSVIRTLWKPRKLGFRVEGPAWGV